MVLGIVNCSTNMSGYTPAASARRRLKVGFLRSDYRFAAEVEFVWNRGAESSHPELYYCNYSRSWQQTRLKNTLFLFSSLSFSHYLKKMRYVSRL